MSAVICGVFLFYAFVCGMVSKPSGVDYTLWHPQGIVIAVVAVFGVLCLFGVGGCDSCERLTRERDELRRAIGELKL